MCGGSHEEVRKRSLEWLYGAQGRAEVEAENG